MSALRFDLKGKRGYVAGHKGMAGSAIVRRLAREDCEIVTADRQMLDVCQLSALGWSPKGLLRDALAAACADFLANGGRVAA